MGRNADANANSSLRPVVLLHGLTRTVHSMALLATALEAEGWLAFNWGYSSRRFAVADLAAQMRFRLAGLHSLTNGNPVDFVTHSLGGLVLRAALADPPPLRIGRIVMIAPPNSGAHIAEIYGHWVAARKVFGKPLDDLRRGESFTARLPIPRTQIGIIAGTRRFHPLNPISYANLLAGNVEAHDGTVEVDRTKLPGMADHILLHEDHTLMPRRPAVIAQAVAFLANGAFLR